MKTLFRIICICTFAVLVVFGCGGDDCPVCPDDVVAHENVYHFLYSFVDTGYWVMTYETESLTIVDSVRYGRWPFEDVDFTSDGKYACYTGSDGDPVTWITDYLSGDTIAYISGYGGHRIQVSPDNQYVVVHDSRETTVFEIPQLSIVYQNSERTYGGADWHSMEAKLYLPLATIDTVIVVSLNGGSTAEERYQTSTTQGSPLSPVVVCSVPGTRHILVGGTRADGQAMIQIRDSASFALEREYVGISGQLYPSPNGSSVYIVQTAGRDDYFPSRIYRLDLSTYLVKLVLDGADFQADSDHPMPFRVARMEITPDSRFAILLNNFFGMGTGPIIKLDLTTFEISEVEYPRFPVSRVLRVYPIQQN